MPDVTQGFIRQAGLLPARPPVDVIPEKPDALTPSDHAFVLISWIGGVCHPFCIVQGSAGNIKFIGGK